MIAVILVLAAATDIAVVDRGAGAERTAAAMTSALGVFPDTIVLPPAETERIDAEVIASCAHDEACLVRALASYDLFAIVFVDADSVSVIERKARTLVRVSAATTADIAVALNDAAHPKPIEPPSKLPAPANEVKKPVETTPVVQTPPTTVTPPSIEQAPPPSLLPVVVMGAGALVAAVGLTTGLMFEQLNQDLFVDLRAGRRIDEHDKAVAWEAYEIASFVVAGVGAAIAGAGAVWWAVE